jgi:hypothetical protein
MQAELTRAEDNRPILNKYLKYVTPSAQIKFINDIKKYNMNNPDNRFLSTMAQGLRDVLYQQYVKTINEKFDDRGQTVFTDVLGVFYYFYEDGNVPQNTYKNNFYRDLDFYKQMKKVAAKIKEIERHTEEKLTDEEVFEFIRTALFCTKSREVFDAENSEVGKVLQKMRTQSYWATHADIIELAEVFNVQLQTSGVGVDGSQTKNDPRPIVCLHHPNKSHWTTQVNGIYVPDNRFQLDRKTGDLASITKQDIIDVMEQYQKGRTWFFRRRHHVGLAGKIKRMCAHDDKSVADVMTYVINHLPHDIDPTGHYFSAVKFLCSKTNRLPELDQKLSEQYADQSRAVLKR